MKIIRLLIQDNSKKLNLNLSVQFSNYLWLFKKKNDKFLTTIKEEGKNKTNTLWFKVTYQLFIIDEKKRREKNRFCFENFQIALSQPPSVRFTFFKNLDRCQESNLNSSDVNTSSDCSRLTSQPIFASGALYSKR